MDKDTNYDTSVAAHYAAYRPPLHEQILKKVLGDRHFLFGLDVGCGMGHSALALSNWCEDVTGVEPSKPMLTHALASPRVSYNQLSSPGQLPFEEATFDIVTFAGSWFYAHSPEMARETYRVAQPNGVILCYDFALDLAEVATFFNHISNPVTYDHTLNFDPYSNIPLKKINQEQQSYSLQLSQDELAHLLLAEDGWRDYLPSLDAGELGQVLKDAAISKVLPCTLYFTHYVKS